MPKRPRPAGLIAELPLDERPRERLLRSGPKALTDAELVAILLKNGRPGTSVLEVAREILVSAGGVPGLAGACARSLRRNGVGEVKLATLLAAVEIASRMALAAVPDRQPLSRPAAVAKFHRSSVRPHGAGSARRAVRQRPPRSARGAGALPQHPAPGLGRAAGDPAPRPPLRRRGGATVPHASLRCHPAPSREDIAFTRRMARAGEIVGVEMVDHMIVGAGGASVSLKERGGW